MSSNRAMLLALLAPTVVAGARPAPPAASRGCSPRHAGSALTAVSLFDGPVSEHADLVPDGDRRVGGAQVSTWDVANVYRAGRKIYASCRYGTDDLVVPVTHAVKTCRYTVRGRMQTLACR